MSEIDLWEIENSLYDQGWKTICGVDEAGRGPLAGPVCAAAVILPRGLVIDGLKDSKKLTEKRRDALYDIILEKAIACSVAFAQVEEIETLNILQATFLAMKRAVEGLDVKPDLAIVDGNREPALHIPCQTIVKGDAKAASIAAASILAKVTRDRYMTQLAIEYPGYGFEIHKGYGTKKHYQAIFHNGVCPAHRMSFLKNLESKREQANG